MSRPKHARTALLAFLVAFSGAVTPGPMLALVIGQVLAQGMTAVVFILAGHAMIEVVFVLCFAWGLTGILARARVRGALALVGGLALVWMGADILATVQQAAIGGAEATATGALRLVAAGVGVSLSNPYFTGWWATVGSGQMATLELRDRADYLAFFVGHELGDIVWFLFVAAALVLGREWLTETTYRRLLGVCGGVLVALGVGFVTVGLRYLRRGIPPDLPDLPVNHSG